MHLHHVLAQHGIHHISGQVGLSEQWTAQADSPEERGQPQWLLEAPTDEASQGARTATSHPMARTFSTTQKLPVWLSAILGCGEGRIQRSGSASHAADATRRIAGAAVEEWRADSVKRKRRAKMKKHKWKKRRKLLRRKSKVSQGGSK